jgi:hypothetical protein
MIAVKAAKEMWGLPSSRGNIRGTSLEDDNIELEGVLSSCDIFVTSDLVLMHKDYFWNVIRPRVNIGFFL